MVLPPKSKVHEMRNDADTSNLCVYFWTKDYMPMVKAISYQINGVLNPKQKAKPYLFIKDLRWKQT